MENESKNRKINAELLAPAGNYGKLLTAFHFGADAVYIGGKNFSMRTFADNFTMDELASAVKFAHERAKKVYVTTNIFAKNADFLQLGEYSVTYTAELCGFSDVYFVSRQFKEYMGITPTAFVKKYISSK